MKNLFKRLFSVIILALGLITTSSCEFEPEDFVSKVAFTQDDWKSSDFMTTGLGVVTLKTSVDGDTAHFYSGKYNKVVQGRFNGVDTPESTGVIEPWGKKAATFTRETLTNAKTIVLETERTDGKTGPEADSTGDRYLVWVWTSTRSVEEEDGSQLRLLNLALVQEGLSPSKGTAGSRYEDTFLDADAQAQKMKINIWSEEKDPQYYYGEAQITNMKEVFSNPSEWLAQKVYVEGVVTRTMGTNAYIQDTYYNEDGTEEVYGAYIYTMYKQYDILKKGNRIGVIGIIGEYMGSYQIVDVTYNPYTPGKNDMKLLETGITVEPTVLTVDEANQGNHMAVLCKMENLRVTGGYGGLYEYDKNGLKNEDNAMTLYVKDENGKDFNIRIDASTFIRDTDGNQICSYKYFVNYCNQGAGYTFDFVGLMGKYTSLTTDKTEIQLMLVATSDLTYNTPNE